MIWFRKKELLPHSKLEMWKKILAKSATTSVMLAAIALSAHAQPPVAPLNQPELTQTEKIAIQSIQTEQTQLQAKIQQVLADIKAQHPGFELGPNMTLVKIPPVPATAPASKSAPSKGSTK